VIEGLGADRERLLANLRGGGGPAGGSGVGLTGGVLAEPAYILLAESGVSDAHEVIRKITLNAEKSNISFAQALVQEPDVLEKIGGKMMELGLVASPKEALAFFNKPERYCGLAAHKAKSLARKYKALMGG
jgi:adenylosuccinate lyase